MQMSLKDKFGANVNVMSENKNGLLSNYWMYNRPTGVACCSISFAGKYCSFLPIAPMNAPSVNS